MASSGMVDQANAEALRIAQTAEKVIVSQPSVFSTALSSLLGQAEDTTQWQRYEELLVACLRTGDEQSAQAILKKLIARFGADNERVMGLRGLYQEAVAPDRNALEAILKEYEEILYKNRANIPICKRRIALLKSLQQPEKAVAWAVELVKLSPTDIEAWSELSDLYISLGQYGQALFALQEVLLTLPNAWNVHARLGEILYMSTSASGVSKADTESALSDAIRRYCRSIELCDGYIRGYYGLALTTEKYLGLFGDSRNPSAGADSVAVESAQRLNKRAIEELRAIVDARGASYDEAEVAAAREFLQKRS